MRLASRSSWLAAAVVVVGVVAAVMLWFALDPRYYSAAEVDARPIPLARIDIAPPAMPGGADYYGKLKLNVFIARSGAVERVEVVTATVPASFRDAAVQAFSQARWEPARKGWRKVNSVKVVEVDFTSPARNPGRPPMRPDS